MASNKKSSGLLLLHIDDNANDRYLIEAAVDSSSTPFMFRGAADLEAATGYFGFLPQLYAEAGRGRPAIVLLDYDLGNSHGTDFLYWLRTQHGNTSIPVVMYSDSADEDLISECYAQGANCFLRKAQTFMRAIAVVHALHSCFFLRTLQLEYLERLPECKPDPRLVH